MTQGFSETSVKTKKNRQSSPLKPAIDGEKLQQQLAEHFENLEDPRGSQGVKKIQFVLKEYLQMLMLIMIVILAS